MQPDTAGLLALDGDTEFDFLYRQYAEWRRFRSLIPLKRHMNVLEYGCGAGRWALLIGPHVHRVIAVDYSEEMIRLARQRQQQTGLDGRVEFVTASATEFTSDLKFDLIYFSSVLQYLDDNDCRQTIRNAVSMLAPCGIMIDRSTCSAPNRKHFNDNSYQAIYRTKEELESTFADFNFKVTYHRQSYPRRRLPGRLLVRPRVVAGLASCMRGFPALSYGLIRMISVLLNSLRPIPKKASAPFRSHDFFRYELTKSG
ncbi:MAG: class I SAM-dependent methyltransferase [Verrucomicrobiota bacterium]